MECLPARYPAPMLDARVLLDHVWPQTGFSNPWGLRFCDSEVNIETRDLIWDMGSDQYACLSRNIWMRIHKVHGVHSENGPALIRLKGDTDPQYCLFSKRVSVSEWRVMIGKSTESDLSQYLKEI